MSLAWDLMEQADHLVTLERTRPKQASLRRAVSAAYYGLFHLLTSAAAGMVAPNVPEHINHRVQRWLDHGEMKKVCRRFLANQLTNPLADLIGQTASEQMQAVARTFVLLQDARHSADYDLSWSVTRSEASQLIGAAWDAFEAWDEIRNTAEANIFLLSLLLWKNWERERLPL